MSIEKKNLKGTQIKYRAGIKYIIAEDWSIDLNLFLRFPGLPVDVVTDLVELTKDGVLTLRKYFFSDGPSGPTVDDESDLRTGFTHDGLYYLLRKGELPPTFRAYADKLLEELGLADGMQPLRAGIWHQGVEIFAAGSAKVGYDPYPVQVAPMLIEHKPNNSFSFGPESLRQ